MQMIRLLPVLALAGALLSHGAAAQAPLYARAAGDTLRYREVAERWIQVPGEPRKLQRQDAAIAITFGAGDTARAWYDSLQFGVMDGERTTRADVAGRVFVLAFGARGVDTALSVPVFPDDVRTRADLRWQFWDFFPHLPEGPLAPGTAWADTITRERTVEGGGNEVTSADTRIATYRVVGDSVIGAHAVVVVEAQAETNGRLGGQLFGLAVRGTSRETERGRIYFDEARGVLVRRTRTAEGVVDVVFPSETGQPRSVRRRDEFSATIDLLDGAPR